MREKIKIQGKIKESGGKCRLENERILAQNHKNKLKKGKK